MSAEAIYMENELRRETDSFVTQRLRITQIAAALLRTPGYIETLESSSEVTDEDRVRTDRLLSDLGVA